MKGKRKIILALVMMLVASICGVGIITAGAEEPADSESALLAKCAAMTESDDILNLSLTVGEFINNVKDDFYDSDTQNGLQEQWAVLTQIVPEEVLLADEDFLYVGKEYMFYIKYNESVVSTVHELFLVDYSYNMDYYTNTLTYSINILSADCWINTYVEGNETTHGVYIIEQDKYYLSAPKLNVYLRNLHTYNEFDDEYQKQNDPGAIINQSRLNYRGAYTLVSADLVPLTKATLSVTTGFFAPGVEEVLDNILTAIDFIDALGSTFTTETVEIEAGNEDNIITNTTKAIQQSDPDINKLTKLYEYKFQETAYLDDYIEIKLLLSEEQEPLLIGLGTVFDIKNDRGNKITEQSISVSAEKELYEKTYFLEGEENELAYMYPQLKQVFSYNAPITADYTLTVPSGCTATVYENYDMLTKTGSKQVDLNDGITTLIKDTQYYIELKILFEFCKFSH